MRIARLASENPRTQGAARRAFYRRVSPRHLESVAALLAEARQACADSVRRPAVVLGAGACTDVPLDQLAREYPQVLLVDVDVAGMVRAREELPASLRGRVDLAPADISGGISASLAAQLQRQPWDDLALLGASGGRAALDAAAQALETCAVPHSPALPGLSEGGYGLVVSDLVLTQLFSLPLLDVLDTLALHAPAAADLRDAYPRYRAAAQTFRRRVVLAHLSLLERLLAPDGVAVLLTDRTGYLLPPRSGPHAAEPAEALDVLPPEVLRIPDDLAARFECTGAPRTWRWLVTAPDATHPGRRYEVVGMLLRPRTT